MLPRRRRPMLGPHALIQPESNDPLHRRGALELFVDSFPSLEQVAAMPTPPPPRELSWDEQLEEAIQAISMAPLVGDALGVGYDTGTMLRDPEQRTLRNLGLTALGALPLIPGIARPVGRALDREEFLGPAGPRMEGERLQYADTRRKDLVTKKRRQAEQTAASGKAYDPESPVEYDFHLDWETGKQLGPVERQGRVDMLADNMVADMERIRNAAAQGDRNAQLILQNHDWYRRTKGALTEAFGEGDIVTRGRVEAAFSPNTAPLDQHKYATEMMRQYTAGELDDTLDAYRKHLAGGGNSKNFPKDQYPKMPDGNLMGMNTTGGLQTLIEMEDAGQVAFKAGMPPKRFRYGSNIIGESQLAGESGFRPTIDVWMGRYFQRIAGRPPVFKSKTPKGTKIEPKLKGAYAAPGSYKKGQSRHFSSPWTDEAGKPMYATPEITGDYGVASDATELAAARLGVEPDELQAVAWLREKNLWEQWGWTPIDAEPDLADTIFRNARERGGL